MRTSRASLRPWEMGCIVAGFPSNIAALQFEWAWHNAHLTRHISPEQRISFATTRTKTSKSGKVSRRPGRPRGTLLDKLSNLHLLLRAPYFSKWPLEIRFFSEEVYRSWNTWCGRVDAHIRPDIKVLLDPVQPQLQEEEEEFSSAQPQPSQRRKRKADLIGRGGPEGTDPTYARLRGVFEKSQFLLDEGDDQTCSICAGEVDIRKSLFVICHTGACQSIAHVSCLADTSLKRKKSASSIVPEAATCPACSQERPWLELMQQVTLRNRGMKEIKKLLAKKGKRSTAAVAADIMETESDNESEEDEALTAKHVVDEEAGLSSQEEEENDDDDDDDKSSIASADSSISRTSNASKKDNVKPRVRGKAKTKAKLEMVIEDSEDER